MQLGGDIVYKPNRPKNGRAYYECVLLDINTQRDFAEVSGSMPVANADTLGSSLRRVVAWAKWNSAPVVSSVESHRPMELSESGSPISCLDGSCGQEKLPYTIFESRTKIEFDNTVCVKTSLFRNYQQVIFRKRTEDFFDNPKADRFLTQLPVREYIVFGTGLETTIKSVVLGLLNRGKYVAILTDACGYWNQGTADLALRQLEAKGARALRSEELLGRTLERRRPVIRSTSLRFANGRARSNAQGRQKQTRGGRDGRAHQPLQARPMKDSMPDAQARLEE